MKKWAILACLLWASPAFAQSPYEQFLKSREMQRRAEATQEAYKQLREAGAALRACITDNPGDPAKCKAQNDLYEVNRKIYADLSR